MRLYNCVTCLFISNEDLQTVSGLHTVPQTFECLDLSNDVSCWWQ